MPKDSRPPPTGTNGSLKSNFPRNHRHAGGARRPPRRALAVMTPISNKKQCFVLAAFLAARFIVALAGGAVTTGAVREWYPTLAKPTWSPPAWIFGPAWTLLYALMAMAGWPVWRRAGWCGALVWFAVQLAPNAAWSTLFSGWHRIDPALGDIALLRLAIVGTTLVSWKATPLAGWLFSPYLAWVSFASALNFGIWRLNSGRAGPRPPRCPAQADRRPPRLPFPHPFSRLIKLSLGFREPLPTPVCIPGVSGSAVERSFRSSGESSFPVSRD